MLQAQLTDADGSESFVALALIVTGLPSATSAGDGFDLGDVGGLPAGASVELNAGPDGQTLVIVIPAGLPEGPPRTSMPG